LKHTIIFILALISHNAISQSDDCALATPIILTAGAACVNGTTVGATSDNTFYASCNPSPTVVNEVWYTYTTNGSVNNFTITPGTLTNVEFILYTGGCPSGGGAFQTCATANGSNILNQSWGMSGAGVQVWIGIASVGGTEGTFQLCITSNPPISAIGNTCTLVFPLCSLDSFAYNTMVTNSSGQTSTCFGSAAQRDVWFKFTVVQSGILAWKAMPLVSTTEFDWVLWDITSGCPGVEVCCNYDYANGSSSGFGMQDIVGNALCGTQSYSTNHLQEFSATKNVIAGKTYAIQIDNYNNTNNGFSFSWLNSTCDIGGCLTGLDNIDVINNNVSVYPNPFQTTATIRINEKLRSKEIELIIYDVFGREIKSQKCNRTSEITINRELLANGIYLYKLKQSNIIVATGKFVVN
jgi:hypothetical protein